MNMVVCTWRKHVPFIRRTNRILPLSQSASFHRLLKKHSHGGTDILMPANVGFSISADQINMEEIKDNI